MAYPWFRLYSEILRDPKVLRLTPRERWGWIGLLCLASDAEERGVLRISESVPYELDDLAHLLDIGAEDVDSLLSKAEELDMLEIDEHRTIRITHFLDRQYDKPSDRPEETRERKRRQRERDVHAMAEASVTPMSRDDHATDPDTDPDTDPETTTAAAGPESPSDKHNGETVALQVLMDRSGVIVGSTMQAQEWDSLLEITPDMALIGEAFQDCAAQGKRPSPKYIRAILERCLVDGTRPGVKPHETGPSPPSAKRNPVDLRAVIEANLEKARKRDRL